jgi:hypothetical protein
MLSDTFYLRKGRNKCERERERVFNINENNLILMRGREKDKRGDGL